LSISRCLREATQIGRTGCLSVNAGVTGAVDAAGAGLSATVGGSFGTSSECRCGTGKESVGLMCCVHKARLTIKVANPTILLSLSLPDPSSSSSSSSFSSSSELVTVSLSTFVEST
jgi:hypothetical protein